MTRKFQVGDRALINRPDRKSHGWEVVITSGLHWMPRIDHYSGRIGEPEQVYSIEYTDPSAPKPISKSYAARPDELQPLYDGDEPALWEDCAWKPKQTEIVN